MNFFEGFRIKNLKPQNNEKPILEISRTLGPVQQYYEYKNGKRILQDLSNEALILSYRYSLDAYSFEVHRWNYMREKPIPFIDVERFKGFYLGGEGSEKLKKQDDQTAKARRELNEVEKEIRRRGIPEDKLL